MSRNLAPIAYTTSKLFVYRPGQAASHRRMFEDAISPLGLGLRLPVARKLLISLTTKETDALK